MVKFIPTSATNNEYEVRNFLDDSGQGWLLGYLVAHGTLWLFKPSASTIYGAGMLTDIAVELAKLNGTTLQ
jgi:hypothetical protein